MPGLSDFRGTSEAWISSRTGETCSIREEGMPERFLEKHRAAPANIYG